jgi:hypothetical protein
MGNQPHRPRYLIVGGTTKAATTSVFTYLDDHPDVCGATLKETRYFLDASYPLPIPRSYRTGGIEGYERYFAPCSQKPVRVEATPDYLYSPGTPGAVSRHVKDVRWVFVLRDPVDRLVSWFRYARQDGKVDRECSFEAYVRRQLEDAPRPSTQPWRALEQGRYARYLRAYVEAFGRDRVAVVFLEHLAEDPRDVMTRIATIAGVDAGFYDDYAFNVENETRAVKSPRLHAVYRWMLRTVRYRVHHWPRLHRVFRTLRSWMDPLYYALVGDTGDADVDLSPNLEDRLRQYYAADTADLVNLVGRTPPWHHGDAS